MSATGLWNIVVKTPMGEQKNSLNFNVDGATLTGTMTDKEGSQEIFNGKVDGDNLSWSAKMTKPMAMTLNFTATLSGDTITGGAKTPFGTAPFTGTRG